MICAALIYAKTFLDTPKNLPYLNKGITILLVIRSVFFIATFYEPQLGNSTWIDIVPLLYIYALGIVSLLAGFSMARFYILAFTLFFSGFIVTLLKDFLWISTHPLMVYGFNVGVLCEMLLLSLALADRIKFLTLDKEAAQKEMIAKSKENETLKDKINNELERRVEERTKALEDKNKEMDTFLYRSSHDIQGPLKSIIGLTTVGMLDIKDQETSYYFEHILKSSKKLDSVIDHLVKVMETKELPLHIEGISLDLILQEIKDSFALLPDYSKVHLLIDIQNTRPFHSDKKIIFDLLYNLIENGIKYKDEHKIECFVKVSVNFKEDEAWIEIKDNGVGMEKKFQEKIFDLLYKVNPESTGSGLGLYMTKMYVEKLSGNLDIESEVGVGTIVRLKLKNHLSYTRTQTLAISTN